METHVFLLVLFAAACHAGWNAALKFGLEPFIATALIAIASGIVALPLSPFVGLPPPVAWPWVIASVILHVGYYIGLTEAYRSGDMGQVYPIARGSAPLLTALASAALIGERVGALGWAGIFLLAGGVFLMSLRGGRDIAKLNRRAVGFALFTACTICGYSIIDGVGARLSDNAHAYSVTLFICDGLAMAVLAFVRRGPAVAVAMVRHWPMAFIGGTLSFAAYWIAIWAMTVAPIAIVAALRETSVPIWCSHCRGRTARAVARNAHRGRAPYRLRPCTAAAVLSRYFALRTTASQGRRARGKADDSRRHNRS